MITESRALEIPLKFADKYKHLRSATPAQMTCFSAVSRLNLL